MRLKKISLILITLIGIRSSNISLAKPACLEAIFFDMDGVLVDTEFLKFQAWQGALKRDLNIDFTLDEYNKLVGLSSEEILDKIISSRSHLDDSSIDKKKLYYIIIV